MKSEIFKVTYNSSERHILLCGDIESNPGPATSNVVTASSRGIGSIGSDLVFNDRLQRHGLIPQEVGGMGNCFFRAI